MNHEQIHLLLSAYVDGELEPSEQSTLAAHLETCSDCRERVRQMLTVKQSVHAAGNFELPYSFASSLVRSIHHEEQKDVSWLGIEHYAGKFVLGLTMLVLFLIGLTTFRQNEEPLPMERYISGLTSDSAASQILTKHGAVTRDDVLIAVLTK